MVDNIRKIGGSAMMRLVVEDEARTDTLVNPTHPDQSEMTPQEPELAKLRKKRKSMAAAAEDSIAEPSAELLDGADGPIQDAAEDDAADSSEISVDLGNLEALLFSTHHPLTAQRLAELMECSRQSPIRKAIKALNASYEESRRAFRIEQVAGGYQMLTLPEFGDALKRLHQKEIDTKLTKSALETLAIIAYKQPILRADIEAIRGVACGETIRSLMEKHLVRIGGRAELPGRPILYGTTKRFLELFGLNTLKDLPQGEELQPPKP
jgi:segregation and condensation protein B